LRLREIRAQRKEKEGGTDSERALLAAYGGKRKKKDEHDTDQCLADEYGGPKKLSFAAADDSEGKGRGRRRGKDGWERRPSLLVRDPTTERGEGGGRAIALVNFVDLRSAR